jgi:hypothetical protein
MVSLDPYINETTRHAHIILPPTSPLEHDHYDIAFHINAVRNTARYNPPVFEPDADKLHDWEIFTALGERVARRSARSQRKSMPRRTRWSTWDCSSAPTARIRSTGSACEVLRDNPSGVDLGPLKPLLPERLLTADKHIDCASEAPLADLARLAAAFTAPPQASPLRLIGRRHVRSNNSWMHNYHRLVKGKARDQLQVHPRDLAELGLATATGAAALAQRRGQVTLQSSGRDARRGEPAPRLRSWPRGGAAAHRRSIMPVYPVTTSRTRLTSTSCRATRRERRAGHADAGTPFLDPPAGEGSTTWKCRRSSSGWSCWRWSSTSSASTTRWSA